jgi:hypothetical protein
MLGVWYIHVYLKPYTMVLCVILFDHKHLYSIISNNIVPILQFSRTPAPGYFNDDDVLDFMIHWNLGVWISYNDTKVTIYMISLAHGCVVISQRY